MNELFIRNFVAQLKRGTITSKTELVNYLLKLDEEVKELNISYDGEAGYVDSSEIADVMLVCASLLIHIGLNPVEILEKKVKVNEQRGNYIELQNAVNYASNLLSESVNYKPELLNCISVLSKNVVL